MHKESEIKYNLMKLIYQYILIYIQISSFTFASHVWSYLLSLFLGGRVQSLSHRNTVNRNCTHKKPVFAKWVRMRGYTVFHHCMLVVSEPGQLLYVQDRRDKQVIFHTFGMLIVLTTASTCTKARLPSATVTTLHSSTALSLEIVTHSRSTFEGKTTQSMESITTTKITTHFSEVVTCNQSTRKSNFAAMTVSERVTFRMHKPTRPFSTDRLFASKTLQSTESTSISIFTATTASEMTPRTPKPTCAFSTYKPLTGFNTDKSFTGKTLQSMEGTEKLTFTSRRAWEIVTPYRRNPTYDFSTRKAATNGSAFSTDKSFMGKLLQSMEGTSKSFFSATTTSNIATPYRRKLSYHLSTGKRATSTRAFSTDKSFIGRMLQNTEGTSMSKPILTTHSAAAEMTTTRFTVHSTEAETAKKTHK